MAAALSRRTTRDFESCSIDTHPSSLRSPLPVTLRISFNPAKNLALVRVRFTVEAFEEPLFLYVPPDHIAGLSVLPGPRLYIHATSLHLIAPQGGIGQLVAADARFHTLRWLASQTALCVTLPMSDDEASTHELLTPLCAALHRGGLLTDKAQNDIRSLYRGVGGQVVQIRDNLYSSASTPSGATVPEPESPPVDLDLFAPMPPSDAELPPYSNGKVESLTPPPPSSPWLAPSKKRQRSRAPSPSDGSSPPVRNWAHLRLACGEREKMMAELLRRADGTASTLAALLHEAELKEARMQERIAQLDAIIGRAEATADASGLQQRRPGSEELRVSQVSTATAASASRSRSGSNAASVCSNVSERVQAYVVTQLGQLRADLATEYATHNAVEQRIDEMFECALAGYVRDDELLTAIQEAIDGALDQVRARVLQSWE